jgi:hypothetical protein
VAALPPPQAHQLFGVNAVHVTVLEALVGDPRTQADALTDFAGLTPLYEVPRALTFKNALPALAGDTPGSPQLPAELRALFNVFFAPFTRVLEEYLAAATAAAAESVVGAGGASSSGGGSSPKASAAAAAAAAQPADAGGAATAAAAAAEDAP